LKNFHNITQTHAHTQTYTHTHTYTHNVIATTLETASDINFSFIYLINFHDSVF